MLKIRQQIYPLLGTWCSIAALALVSNALAAPVDVSVSAFADISYDENPLRESSNSPDIIENERKDTLGLNLGLTHSSNSSNLDMAYTVARDEYEKSSQDDETRYLGQSTYELGNESTYYGLTVSHQLTRKLNAPDAAEVNSNINEVSTLTVEPRVSSNPEKATQLELFGIYTDIDYKDTEDRLDTEQTGAELIINRDLSSGYRVFLDLSASTTSFDTDEDLDYDYRRIGLGFSGETRSLNYQLQVGTNTLSPKNDEDDETGTFYSGVLVYQTTSTELEVSVRSELTASSIVGALGEEAQDNGVQGVDGEEDRVEFDDYAIALTTHAFCEHCEYTLAYSLQKVTNINLSENDTELSIWSTSFAYRLSRRSRFVLDIEDREMSFVNDAARDTDSVRVRGRLINQFSKSLAFEAYASNENFDSVDRDYDSSIVGLRFIVDLL